MGAQFVELLLIRRSATRQEALGHTHRADPPRARLLRDALAHTNQLQRAAAEIQHAAFPQCCRVDRRQVAITGLSRAAEHADRQARLLARGRQEVLGVLSVADRAGRKGIDCVRPQPAGSAEVREHVERRHRPAHRLLAEPARRAQSLADAHRLVDLIAALPPVFPGREDDEPKRVRAQIDDRQTLS